MDHLISNIQQIDASKFLLAVAAGILAQSKNMKINFQMIFGMER